MIQSFILLLVLLIMIAVIAYFVMGLRKYKSEKEKDAFDKGLIAYLFTNSILIGWLVYRKNKDDDQL